MSVRNKHRCGVVKGEKVEVRLEFPEKGEFFVVFLIESGTLCSVVCKVEEIFVK